METLDVKLAGRNLSKLVDRASKGERIGITREGKFLAILAPPSSQEQLERIFEDIESIRKRVRGRVNVKELIQYGRM